MFYLKLFLIPIFIFIFLGCSTSYTDNIKLNQVANIECKKLTKINHSPWHINNLYDCKTKTWFIPYQLWSGAKYSGNKKESISHKVNGTKYVAYKNHNGYNRDIEISGTIKKLNEANNIVYDAYIKKFYKKGLNNYKTQYFVANHMGIGRIYDTRYGFYPIVGIKFPAGYGWELNKIREINSGERKRGIIITNITLNSSNELDRITYKWFRNDILNYSYTYKVGIGRYDAFKY